MKIILAGIRPTVGGLHLGHLVGNIRPILESESPCRSYLVLSDLTLLPEIGSQASPSEIYTSQAAEMVADALACGLTKTTIFRQSSVAENVLPLFFLFAGLTTVNRLQRLPVLKNSIRRGDILSAAMLNFPLLQVADIAALKAEHVAANADNQTYVELTREILRRFNRKFVEILPLPTLQTGRVPYLPGLDGAKMSKAKRNCIYLTDSEEVIRAKVRSMYTDPRRTHANIPADPEKNPVLIYHKALNPDIAEVASMRRRYKKGRIGDVEIKDRLSQILIDLINPIRNRSLEFRQDPSTLLQILKEGSESAQRAIAQTRIEITTRTGIPI